MMPCRVTASLSLEKSSQIPIPAHPTMPIPTVLGHPRERPTAPCAAVLCTTAVGMPSLLSVFLKATSVRLESDERPLKLGKSQVIKHKHRLQPPNFEHVFQFAPNSPGGISKRLSTTGVQTYTQTQCWCSSPGAHQHQVHIVSRELQLLLATQYK